MKIILKKLFAGPFVGEFGWELFCYQGILRNISSNYDEVHIICTPGKEVLYEDFATTIKTFKPQGYEPDGAVNLQPIGDFPKPTPDGHAWDYVPPNTKLVQYHSHNGSWAPNVIQTHKVFGEKTDQQYDIVFHARGTNKSGTGVRNWNEEKWVELISKLKETNPDIKLACIGTKNAAMWFEGTDDLRDLDLENLCNTLHSSKLCIGPSSGPMHLASLCGTPHLVWSPKLNYARYTEDWNPHNTQVVFLEAEDWNPTVKQVYDSIHSTHSR